jgi:hypothetical protein
MKLADVDERNWQAAPGKDPLYWDGRAWLEEPPSSAPPPWKLGLSTGGVVFLLALLLLLVSLMSLAVWWVSTGPLAG